MPPEAAIKAGDPKLLTNLRNSKETPWEERLRHPSLQYARHAAPCCHLLVALSTTTTAWSEWLAHLELLKAQTAGVFLKVRVRVAT